MARSVSASAGIASAAAAATASSMRTVPSAIEYSLCRRRWTKRGCGHGTSCGMLEFYPAHRQILLRSSRDSLRDRLPSRHAVASARARGVAARSLAPAALALARARDARRRRAPTAPPRRRAPPLPRERRAAAAAPSTCRVFRCRIARATPTAARAPAGASARTPRASRATATTAPAGRTASRCARRSSASRASRAMKPLARTASRCAASPPRAHVGRSRGAASSSCCTAGWTSARRSSSWSTRSRAIGTRSRPTCAASAAARGSRRATGSPTTSPISRRCSTASRRASRSTSSATASAATSSCTTPACGRRACARVVSLEGFGIPAEDAGRARRASSRSGSTRCASRPAFAPYREPRRGRRPAAEEQSAAAARQGAVPRAALGRASLPDGTRAARAPIRGTSCRSRRSTGWRRSFAVWRAITAPMLWVAAARFATSRDGSTAHPKARPAADGLAGVRQRLAHVRGARLEIDRRRRRTCCITTSPPPSRAAIEPFLAAATRGMTRRPRIRGARRATSRSSLLTLVWGCNWLAMKLALAHAPIRSSSTCSARGSPIAVLFARARRAAAAAAVRRRGSRSSSPGSSRRRSTSARRRWRSPAAAPGARRCSCSRCRSGRC